MPFQTAAIVAERDPLQNIALVIFDCDGVLIDSEPIASSTLAESLRGAGVEISASESHVKFTGNSVSTIRRMIEDDYGITDIEPLMSSWHETLFRTFGERLTAMPGILEVVSDLQRPKCVASNSSMRRLELSLGHLELWDHFKPAIFSAEAVARPKPAPDLMLHCAQEFKVDPSLCVMIDDSPHGVEAAVAAGMIAIGFVDPADPRPERAKVLRAAGADAVAEGAGELLAALNAANALLASRGS